MADLASIIENQRDPVRSYLASYYGARDLSDREDYRRQQLANQDLANELRRAEADWRTTQSKNAQDAADTAKKDKAHQTFENAIIAFKLTNNGADPTPDQLQGMWLGALAEAGLDPAKHPDPGAYGPVAKSIADAKYQTEIFNRQQKQDKADKGSGWEKVQKGDRYVYIDKATGREVNGYGGPIKDAEGTPRSTQMTPYVDAQGNPLGYDGYGRGLFTIPLPPGAVNTNQQNKDNAADAAKEKTRQSRLDAERKAAIAKPLSYPDYFDTNGNFSENLFQRRAPKNLGLDQAPAAPAPQAPPTGLSVTKTTVSTPAPQAPKGGKPLDVQTAMQYLLKYGDRAKAEAAAKADGYIIQ